MLTRTARAAFILAVSASLSCAGGDPASPTDEIIAALTRWGENGSSSYSITAAGDEVTFEMSNLGLR